MSNLGGDAVRPACTDGHGARRKGVHADGLRRRYRTRTGLPDPVPAWTSGALRADLCRRGGTWLQDETDMVPGGISELGFGAGDHPDGPLLVGITPSLRRVARAVRQRRAGPVPAAVHASPADTAMRVQGIRNGGTRARRRSADRYTSRGPLSSAAPGQDQHPGSRRHGTHHHVMLLTDMCSTSDACRSPSVPPESAGATAPPPFTLPPRQAAVTFQRGNDLMRLLRARAGCGPQPVPVLGGRP